MNCPECGNPNNPVAVECEYCGAALQAGAGAPRKTQLDRGAPPPDPAKRRTVFEPPPPQAPAAGAPVRALPDDPFASPPRSRPVYDPADPFRAALSPGAARPAAPPAPEPAPPASRHATLLQRGDATQARRPAGVFVAFAGPADAGKVHLLFDGRNTVGRDEGQDVVIPDGKISGNHGFVFLRPDGASFIDVSTNGTLVDGKVVHGQQVDITSGAVIRLGETVLLFTRLAPVPVDLWSST